MPRAYYTSVALYMLPFTVCMKNRKISFTSCSGHFSLLTNRDINLYERANQSCFEPGLN